MRIVEYETTTRVFNTLDTGELYRESLGGAIYLKILPVKGKGSVIWNCMNLTTDQLDFTFEDTDVFPVKGAFVENYAE